LIQVNPYNKNVPLIEFIGVNKSLNGKKILDNINFSIQPKEIFGLIGTSGAGKTTLLRLLIGYYSPDSGKIMYNGKDITNDTKNIRKIFGFATQENCFYEELNLLDNMRYFGKMYGMTSKEIAKKSGQLLMLVGLWESREKKASELSGGMQRRLDLALSMIHNPEILILDEPTTGLDIVLRKRMWTLIKQINLMGVTILMSSHMLDEIEQLCSNIIMVKEGKVVLKGSPKQLENFYSKNEEVCLETSPGRYRQIISEFTKRNIPVFYPKVENNRLTFYTPSLYNIIQVAPQVLKYMGETIISIKIDKPDLNEVFEAVSAYTLIDTKQKK